MDYGKRTRSLPRVRQSGGVTTISVFRKVATVALIGLIPAATAHAQTAQSDALQELRQELDQLRADQARRQQQIDDLQRRLDTFESGAAAASARPVDPTTQGELRGRGVAPAANEAPPLTVLQIGSFRSEAEARFALADLRTKHAGALANSPSGVQVAEIGPMGTWYRIYVGPFSERASASLVCDALRAQGAGCVLGTMMQPTIVAAAAPPSDPGLDVGQRLSEAEQAELRGRGAAPPTQLAGAAPQPTMPPPSQGAPAGGENEEMVVREAAPAQSVVAVTETQQGIFGGQVSFEVGFSYSHFDQARINLSGFLALDSIFLGRISIDETEGDVTTLDFVARYRPTPRLQFDVGVPVIARVSTYRSGGAGSSASGLAEVSRRTIGLADMSVGASFRAFTETMSRPDIVVSARVKAPTGRHPYGVSLVEIEGTGGNLKVPEKLGTGSGTWGASLGVSALKTVDPVVLFGNFSYFRNFEEEFEDISEVPGLQPGVVKTGDAFQYGAGVAFAVNERSSLSFSFTQRFVETTSLRGLSGAFSPIIGSHANVASLNVGSTFAFSQRASVIVNVAAGLTRDTPDFSLVTRVPFSF
jgi:hypothetical protein